MIYEYRKECFTTTHQVEDRSGTSENKAEVDFLVQYENMIVPIEVKSDENVRSKSLAFYRKEFNPGLSIRYSLRNLKREEGFINIPLFMVDQTQKILAMS